VFKEIISHQGFWRSVVTLALSFVVLFVLVKWAIEGFSMEFFTRQDPLLFWGGLFVAGFIYGFLWTYGKFKKRIKEGRGN
jgi:hypothetical protein